MKTCFLAQVLLGGTLVLVGCDAPELAAPETKVHGVLFDEVGDDDDDEDDDDGNDNVQAQFLGLTQWTTGPGANGHWYAITEAAGDFRDIKTLAGSLGGTLVSITSAAENEFVYNNFVALGTCAPVWCQPATFYIGLERVSSGGPFAWLTGEPLVFTAWNTGEPNNAGDERVAHMFKVGGEVLWNDISFTSNPMRGVIEWTEDPTLDNS